MVWPFNQPIRGMIGSALFWYERGESWEWIEQKLLSERHRASEVAQALPEARRALLFREQIEADTRGRTLGQLWDTYWLSIFTQAYGRAPTADELYWAQSRPGGSVGMMAEVTLSGVSSEQYAITPTIEAMWAETWAEIQARILDWYWFNNNINTIGAANVTLPTSVEQVQINLVRGVLLSRMKPTIEL